MFTGDISASFKSRLLRMFLLICFGLTFLTIFSGTVLADTSGPTFGQVFPADGMTRTYPTFTISLVAQDNDIIDITSLVMKVDGVAVKPITQYAPIDESTDDYTTLEIYYPGVFSTGTHTVNVSIKDRLKNTGTLTWSFIVASPLRILTLEPSTGSSVVTTTPTINLNSRKFISRNRLTTA